MLPDYADYEQAIGLDWYAADPNLRLLLDRLLPDAGERDYAEGVVSRYGDLVGRTVAARRSHRQARPGAAPLRPLGQRRRARRAQRDLGGEQGGADQRRVLQVVCRPTRAGPCLPSSLPPSRSRLASRDRRLLRTRHDPVAPPTSSSGTHPAVRDEILWDASPRLDPDELLGGGHVPHRTARRQRRRRKYDTCQYRTATSGDCSARSTSARTSTPTSSSCSPAPTVRRAGAEDLPPSSCRGRLPDGSQNGFSVKRLKPKLGTVGVPTGEVALEGFAVAGPAGTAQDSNGHAPADAARDGRGLNRMMEMVNGSRFGVALMSLGIHRRSFLEAAIYAGNRRTFGNRIDTIRSCERPSWTSSPTSRPA